MNGLGKLNFSFFSVCLGFLQKLSMSLSHCYCKRLNALRHDNRHIPQVMNHSPRRMVNAREFPKFVLPCTMVVFSSIWLLNTIGLLLTTFVDNDESVILSLLELSAVFDTVDHMLLLSRLVNRFGLRGTVVT